jgi:hypothetical protein
MWESNITMDLQEKVCASMGWMIQTRGRLSWTRGVLASWVSQSGSQGRLCSKEQGNVHTYSGAGAAQSLQCLTTYWKNGVWSLAEAMDFSFSLCVHIAPEVHPASCPMSSGGPFPGVKRGWGVTLTIHSIYCRSQEWVGAVFPWHLHGVAGHLYLILSFDLLFCLPISRFPKCI